ncbi:MAG: hypothetical protein ACD_19C00072G0001 [uncultured bacterium]|nr:MAG: hypothetical protein ACD_19C00072G0001 [uncultured bacterium]
MTNLTSDFTSDFSQNPILINSLINQNLLADLHKDTAGTFSIDEYIDTAWPTILFPKDEIDKKTYGPTLFFEKLSPLEDQQKENEWLEIIGIDFYSLPEEKRNFLLKTAGIFDFGQEIDIKKVYTTSIY